MVMESVAVVLGMDLAMLAVPAMARGVSHGARYSTLESFVCMGPGCCDFIDDPHSCKCKYGFHSDPAEVEVYQRWDKAAWGITPIVADSMEQCESFSKSEAVPATAVTSNLDFQSHFYFVNARNEGASFEDNEKKLGYLDGREYDMEKLMENPESYCKSMGGESIVSHKPERRGCKFKGLKSYLKESMKEADIADAVLQEYIECDEDYYGPKCDQHCTDKGTCHGEGVCDFDTGACVCNEGHLRSDCSEICTRNSHCSGNGNCMVSGLKSGHQCQCDDGFFGDDCSCSRDGFCSKRGECNQQSESKKHRPCLCDEGYEGFDCGIKDGECDDACFTNNTRSCVLKANSKWICFCSPHSVGVKCDIPCSCKHGECDAKENGACNREEDCDAGYYGPDCDNECTCEHGTCNDGVNGTGLCAANSCTGGYWGKDCNLMCSCHEGKCPSSLAEFDSETLDENADGVNECSVCNEGWYGAGCYHRCQCNHGNCSGGIGGNGSCIDNSCTDGFEGINCNIKNQIVTTIPVVKQNNAYVWLFGTLAGICVLVAVVMGAMYNQQMFCFALRIPIVQEPDDLDDAPSDDEDFTAVDFKCGADGDDQPLCKGYKDFEIERGGVNQSVDITKGFAKLI